MLNLLSPKCIWGSACVISIGLNFICPKVESAHEPQMRVLLQKSTNVNLRADRKIPLLIKGLDSREKKLTSLKLKKTNGRFVWSSNKKIGLWKNLPSNSQLIIRSFDKRGVWLGNRRYAGELIVRFKGDHFTVINHLGIEKYLKSVVGSEMPKSFSMAALQAQAIAARTYALKQLGKANNYDINSSELNQVYLGMEAETLRTIRAVNRTRSLVLFYQGKLVSAVFHSSSGGQTESSGAVWKYQLPYLISVPDYDQHSPKYQWSKKFNTGDLKKIFHETGGLNSIQVLTKSNTGRVLKARVYGPEGDFFLSGKELRNRMTLNSTLVKFTVLPYPSPRKHIKNKSSLIRKETGLPGPLPLIPKEYILLADGYGSGHGVGMSQWGADGLAKKGANFREILNHYYKGVEIRPY
mgnify:CR=1 FL=1